ncbi:MAG TPA: hypothetical protein VMH83_10030 [Candidatus Acidoferrum sp.]|nr:hypothetical protein [Candidatus Acidoferrum sp.]
MFKSADLETQQRWNELRILFLDRVWRSMLLMAAVAIPISISRSYFTGWQPVYVTHLLFMLTVVLINLLGDRLRYKTRALLVVGMLDAASLSGLFNFGLLGSAWWWMFLGGLLSGHFYNRRVELLHITGTFLLMIVAAYCYVNGIVKVDYDPAEYLRQPSSWLTAMTGPVFMTVLVFRALSIYQDAVHELLQEVELRHKESKELTAKLEQSLAEIKTLHGLIPMCAHCKKVRDDKGYWDNVEAFIQAHSSAKFTHLLCPPCGELLYGDLWRQAVSELEQDSTQIPSS